MHITCVQDSKEEQLLPMCLPIQTREDLEKAAACKRWNEEQREQKLLRGLERARDIFH